MSRQYLSYDSNGLNLTDSPDINIDNLSIAGSSGSANQYLRKDGGNALVWAAGYNIFSRKQSFTANLETNSGATTTLTFNAAAGYDTLGANATFNGTDTFTLNTNGEYKVSIVLNCVPSASDQQINLNMAGGIVATGFLRNGASACVIEHIGSFVATDTLTITSVRLGTAGSKLLVNDLFSSYIIIELRQ